MTICKHRTALVLALVAGLLSASFAGAQPAQDKRKRARALFIEGNKLFAAKQYLPALRKYREARSLFPSYKIDFNIGTTLELLGRPHWAAEHFERFLRGVDRTKETPIVGMAEAKLKTLRGKVASLTLRPCARGVAVTFGGRAVGRTPLRLPIYVTPGSYRLVLRQPGRADYKQAIKLLAGQHRVLAVRWPRPAPRRRKVALVPRAPRPRPRPRAAPFYKKWWFWTAVGVVVVGATVTGGVVATQGGDDRELSGELGTIK